MQDEVEDDGFDKDEILKQWEAETQADSGDGNVVAPEPASLADDLPDDFEEEVISFKGTA